MTKDIYKGSDDVLKLRVRKGDAGGVIELVYNSDSFIYPLRSLYIYLYDIDGNIIQSHGIQFYNGGSGVIEGYEPIILEDSGTGLVSLYLSSEDTLTWSSGPYLINGKIGLEIAGFNEGFIKMFNNPVLAGIIHERIES